MSPKDEFQRVAGNGHHDNFAPQGKVNMFAPVPWQIRLGLIIILIVGLVIINVLTVLGVI